MVINKGANINKNNNSRMTNQRLIILEHLKSVKTHPTAELVYDSVALKLPQITLATVYRNLNLLADKNLILKFTVNDINRFDGDVSNHQHCVCKSCGTIIDIFEEEISKYVMKNFKSKSFNADNVYIKFFGYCNKCNN